MPGSEFLATINRLKPSVGRSTVFSPVTALRSAALWPLLTLFSLGSSQRGREISDCYSTRECWNDLTFTGHRVPKRRTRCDYRVSAILLTRSSVHPNRVAAPTNSRSRTNRDGELSAYTFCDQIEFPSAAREWLASIKVRPQPSRSTGPIVYARGSALITLLGRGATQAPARGKIGKKDSAS
jgi:hypothetical protein